MVIGAETKRLSRSIPINGRFDHDALIAEQEWGLAGKSSNREEVLEACAGETSKMTCYRSVSNSKADGQIQKLKLMSQLPIRHCDRRARMGRRRQRSGGP